MDQGATLQVVCGHCAATNRVPARRLEDKPVCGRCKQALFAGTPIELDAGGFQAMVGRGDIPLLVDFWAPWCGPCRMMAPVYEQAARLLEPRVRVAKLDTERFPDVAASMQIRSIPTLALFRGGRELTRQSGAMDLGTLRRWVEASLAAADSRP